MWRNYRANPDFSDTMENRSARRGVLQARRSARQRKPRFPADNDDPPSILPPTHFLRLTRGVMRRGEAPRELWTDVAFPSP
jgi:hypothetical protein